MTDTLTNNQVQNLIVDTYNLALEAMAEQSQNRSEMVGAIHKYISVIGDYLSEVTDAHEMVAEDLRFFSQELDDTTDSLRKEVVLTGMAATPHICACVEEFDVFTTMWVFSRVGRQLCKALAEWDDKAAGCLTPFEYQQFGRYLISAV